MKKSLFVAAIAALAVVACKKSETTSLKNFKMIETKVSPETKKIILIKFKIQPDEITK